MKYRLALEAELRQLAEMRWAFQIEDDAEKPTLEKAVFLEKCAIYLQKCLAADDWAFWIAEQNGEIISHIFVKTIVSVPRPARLENKWGYVTNVYTKPQFRGRGIGKGLLSAVKIWALERDFEILIVSPGETAVNFYKREGFTAETDFFQLRLREF